MNQERRHVLRQYLRVPATLQTAQAAPIDIHTIDVGLAGIALNAEHPIATNLFVQLCFDVPVSGKLEKVFANGNVSYCAPAPHGFKIGVIFLDLNVHAKAVLAAYLAA